MTASVAAAEDNASPRWPLLQPLLGLFGIVAGLAGFSAALILSLMMARGEAAASSWCLSASAA